MISKRVLNREGDGAQANDRTTGATARKLSVAQTMYVCRARLEDASTLQNNRFVSDVPGAR